MKSLTVLSVLLILVSSGTSASIASQQKSDPNVCDGAADFYLGIEDYPTAIRLHLAILSHAPGNALAHYHLGFAYGMVGRSDDEIREYRHAVALGLQSLDLYLNLGLALFERGELIGATEAFRTASRLTDSPDPHYDLAMAYERRGHLPEAASEIRTALTKTPTQPDYLNMLAVVTAEKGDWAKAREIWTGILSRNPNYSSAAANLRVLEALPPERSIQESALVPSPEIRLLTAGIH